jgi:hypothetical protein
MQEEKVKQMNMDAVDVADTTEAAETSEEQMRNQQITEERNDQNKNKMREDENNFAPLFENEEAEQFRSQWLEIQSRFVDDPSVSVKDADDLVAKVITNITRTFADKRTSMEAQWKSGDVSTEDLRVALKRYRSFFDRLLTLES